MCWKTSQEICKLVLRSRTVFKTVRQGAVARPNRTCWPGTDEHDREEDDLNANHEMRLSEEETANVNHEVGTMTCLYAMSISSSTLHVLTALKICCLFTREAVPMFCSSNLNRPHNGTTRLSEILQFFSLTSSEIRKCISDSCMAR